MRLAPGRMELRCGWGTPGGRSQSSLDSGLISCKPPAYLAGNNFWHLL